ncbi:hypothetical protein [Sorangium sp. So ce388]|uniref:hypothetical protein n=1 Tax=Sorangium sp. So ce388 TaxID=3133309 RepID=UPI003F5AE731
MIPELLASVLAMVLLRIDDERPIYFASPWLSDFVLFRNECDEFLAVAPEFADDGPITFTRYLGRLAQAREVRIVTARTEVSRAFAESPTLRVPGIELRFADGNLHEKGILGPGFYIEGSMNITYRGVYVNGEKITYHAAVDTDGSAKIARAYLEFARRWENIDAAR